MPQVPDDRITLIRKNIHHLSHDDPDWAAAFDRACDSFEDGSQLFELPYLLQLKYYPVSVRQFLFDKVYLGKEPEEIYPEVLKELEQINNPGDLRVVNKYTEFVGTGGIGSAKSTTALYTVAYQLYILSCFADPHAAFNLDRASEILFVFQNIHGGLAKAVDYDRFYQMITHSPYFQNTFPFDTKKKSELLFPHRIQVKAIGADGGAIGQNVMGGLIDEVNFMAITQNSRKDIDGGTYNQALTIYNSIARRRKSRFGRGGAMPGILCLVSSKRYPGEFTDIKIAEAKTDPTIYVYDKRVWDIKPKGTYSDTMFRVYVGDAVKKARIVEEGEVLPPEDAHRVREVPVDFLPDFRADLIGSLRDIAGLSVMAQFPFFSDFTSVDSAFGKRESILNCEESDMESTQVVFYPKRFTSLNQRRWVHIDLGLSADSAGVTCGHVPRFVTTADGLLMPEIAIDFQLRVKPPPNKEIQFFRIRNLVKKLHESGLPIQWITFDSYQSADSIQILRHMGFSTGRVSMDINLAPYTLTKSALYQNRLLAPKHERCKKELLELELLTKVGKIDHPPNGSKDVSDSLAGVVYGLSTRREIWADHGVPVSQAISLLREITTKEVVNEQESHVY